MKVLEAEGLTKSYKSFTAVDDLSLSLEKGEIYGFLGLNGAGKTTTIRMLLGMIRADSGRVSFFGIPRKKRDSQLWERVGYLVESPSAYPELSVWDNLEIVRGLRRLPRESINRVIELLHLGEYRNRPAGRLSLGNLQRLGLAKALIHRPEILLLDEPVNGLDPEGIADIRVLLRRLAAEEGVSILVSSHLLDEVSKLADQIGIIHRGRRVEEIKSSDLEKALTSRVILETKDNLRAEKLLVSLGYKPEPWGQSLRLSEKQAVEIPENLAEVLVGGKIGVRKLVVEKESLETYFLRKIEEKGALL